MPSGQCAQSADQCNAANTWVELSSPVTKVSGYNEAGGSYAAHVVSLHQADGTVASISGMDNSRINNCASMGFGQGQPFEFNVPSGARLHEIDTDCNGRITGIKTTTAYGNSS